MTVNAKQSQNLSVTTFIVLVEGEGWKFIKNQEILKSSQQEIDVGVVVRDCFNDNELIDSLIQESKRALLHLHPLTMIS
jgi:hypothetical protein